MLPRFSVCIRDFRRLHASALRGQLSSSLEAHTLYRSTRLASYLLGFSFPRCDIFMPISHAVCRFKSRDDMGGKLGRLGGRMLASVSVSRSWTLRRTRLRAPPYSLEMELPALYTRSPSWRSSDHDVNDQVAGFGVSAWASLTDRQAPLRLDRMLIRTDENGWKSPSRSNHHSKLLQIQSLRTHLPL